MNRHWIAMPLGETPEDFTLTLKQWNDRRVRQLQEIADQAQHPERYSNGLICDECGADLYDTNQQAQGHPVKILVRCKNCNFRGERYE